jgi:murein DD-endopeptidase MepM/ murein hydrolase activator NlpD
MLKLETQLSRVAEQVFSYFKKLRKVRSGSKISRLFRHFFENIKLRRVLGTNLAVAIVAVSFLPSSNLFNAEAEDSIISVKNAVLTTDREISYPLDKVVITQGFHLFHPGIDLDGVTGDEVRPIMKGVVKEIQHSRFAYGNAIIIDHGNELTSLYAHLSKITVQEGQEVDTFTKIGEVGATGHAIGDHLHLEIRDHGKPINPLSILPPAQ